MLLHKYEIVRFQVVSHDWNSLRQRRKLYGDDEPFELPSFISYELCCMVAWATERESGDCRTHNHPAIDVYHETDGVAQVDLRGGAKQRQSPSSEDIIKLVFWDKNKYIYNTGLMRWNRRHAIHWLMIGLNKNSDCQTEWALVAMFSLKWLGIICSNCYYCLLAQASLSLMIRGLNSLETESTSLRMSRCQRILLGKRLKIFSQILDMCTF